MENKKGKKKYKKVESDHNLIETKLNLAWSTREKVESIEVFNVKNKTCMNAFFEATNNTTELEKIFDTRKPLEVQTKKFIKRINGFIVQCFRKVRIETKVDLKLELLYNKRRFLRSREDDESQAELEELEAELSSLKKELS